VFVHALLSGRPEASISLDGTVDREKDENTGRTESSHSHGRCTDQAVESSDQPAVQKRPRRTPLPTVEGSAVRVARPEFLIALYKVHPQFLPCCRPVVQFRSWVGRELLLYRNGPRLQMTLFTSLQAYPGDPDR
jgi:hypothetical protein